MAHYVAECITAAKNAQDDAAEQAAERLVFETILKLWKHRAGFPRGGRPYRETQEIVAGLEALLNPSLPRLWVRGKGDATPDQESWLNLARGLDGTARDLIRWCISQAVSETSGADAAWSEDKVAQNLNGAEEAEIARLLYRDLSLVFLNEGDRNPQRVDELHEMRKRLDAFAGVARQLRERIDAEIGALEEDHSSS
jgi:hypothetical protein